MTLSTLTLVIAVSSLFFLILGTVVTVISIFIRRIDRNLERSEAKQTEALNQFKTEVIKLFNQQEVRFTEGLNQLEARFTEGLNQLEARFTEGLNQLEVRFTEGLKQLEVRFTEALNQLEVRFTEGLKQQDTRQIEALKQLEVRFTEVLNQFKAEVAAAFRRIEDGQADQNEQIAELVRAMYVLNGQVQRIIGYLRTEGIEVNEDIRAANCPLITQPAISSVSAQG